MNLPPRKRKTRKFHHDLRRCPSERRPSGYRCVFQVRVSTVRAFCPRHVRGNSDEAKLPEFTYTPARAHPACPVCRFGYCVMHTCDMPAGGGAGRAIAPFDEDSMIPPRREEASRARLTKLSVVRSFVRSTTGARSVVAARNVVVKADAKEAAEEVMADLTSGAEDIADKLTKYWEDSDEKPTLVAVGFGGLLALYFVSNLVNAVDRLPLISNVFELVGIIFSGWTAYRYFLVEGEKEKLTSDVKGFLSKVGVNL